MAGVVDPNPKYRNLFRMSEKSFQCLLKLAWRLLTAVAMSVPAYAAPLITAEEAALPPQKGAVANTGRGITRGPKIQVPEETAAQASPMRFQIKFQTFGGSTIDLDALKVTYLKSRSSTYAADQAFRAGDRDRHAGCAAAARRHLVRVDVKDSDGRTASTSFLLKIAP